MSTLAIITDIYGDDENKWLHLYVNALQIYFEIKIYDSRELAGISQI